MEQWPENTSPYIERERETLAMMQINHEQHLQAAGVVERAAHHLSPEWCAKVEATTTAVCVGFIDASHIDPAAPGWITVRFTSYELTDHGSRCTGWIDIPVAEDYGDIQLPWEGFTPEDVALVTSLREELFDARDGGQLSHLRSDLGRID